MPKTYETYKDSGITWIGEIPSEWEVCQFKRVHSGTNVGEGIDKTFWTDNSNDKVFYTAGILPIYTNYCDFPIGKYTKANDILLSRNGTPYVYLPKANSLYTDHIIRVGINSEYDRRFIKYVISQSISYEIVDTVSIATWSASLWNEQIIPIPSLDEQQFIASFLDSKCSDIDSLISLQEEMISELQAYKQSVITEAVTKGLDPKAKMKDSGVEWIGEIPEHWEIKPLKSLFYTEKGLNITKENLVESGIPVLSYGQIHSKENPGTQLNENLFKFVPESYLSSDPGCLVHKGCFLIADTSEDYEGCGNAIYVNRDLTLFAGYHTIIARPLISGEYKYLAYLFLTDNWRSQIRSRVSGIKVFSVNQKHVRATSILLPTESEQKQIALYLDEKVQQINSVISIKQKKIQELKDYKKSIIYEYVTGKKRV